LNAIQALSQLSYGPTLRQVEVSVKLKLKELPKKVKLEEKDGKK
jgi:hypothetical protein